MANSRTANSRSGTIGSLTRFSQARKAASRTPPAASVMTVSALDQPTSLARVSAQTSATAPAVTSPTPVRSSRSEAP